jgi:hypothetical protein
MDECEWCEPVPATHNNLVDVSKIAQLCGSKSSNAEWFDTTTFLKPAQAVVRIF